MFGRSGRHFGIFAVADCGLGEKSSGWDRRGGNWFDSETWDCPWDCSGEGGFEHCGRRGGGINGGESVGTFMYDVMIVGGA